MQVLWQEVAFCFQDAFDVTGLTMCLDLSRLGRMCSNASWFTVDQLQHLKATPCPYRSSIGFKLSPISATNVTSHLRMPKLATILAFQDDPMIGCRVPMRGLTLPIVVEWWSLPDSY